METHAHHLHKAPGNKWTHYLFEFLMLFLAVFCGFLAENQREHLAESKREKQYMKSMVDDLKLDTIDLSRIKARLDTILLPVLNKSVDLLYGDNYSDSVVKKMYEVVPRAIGFLFIDIEDRTKTQLESSGNLRLIRNTEITDSLASYWKACDFLANVYLPSYDNTRITAKDLVYGLFNLNYYEQNNPLKPLRKNVAAKLLPNDRSQLIKLANFISNLNAQASGPIKNQVERTYDAASRLIKLIKDKYHLE